MTCASIDFGFAGALLVGLSGEQITVLTVFVAIGAIRREPE